VLLDQQVQQVPLRQLEVQFHLQEVRLVHQQLEVLLVLQQELPVLVELVAQLVDFLSK
jgi:hypothetical protein